jgi:hypothetical protein
MHIWIRQNEAVIKHKNFSSRFLSSHLDPVGCVIKLKEELLRLDGVAEPELPERGQVPELRVSLLQVAHCVLNVLAREMVGSDHRFRLSHQLIHHLLVALRGMGDGFNQTNSGMFLIGLNTVPVPVLKKRRLVHRNIFFLSLFTSPKHMIIGLP